MGNVLLSLPFTSVTIDGEAGPRVVAGPLPGMEGKNLAPPLIDDAIRGTAVVPEDLIPVWERDLPVRFMGPLAQYRCVVGSHQTTGRIRGFYGQAGDLEMTGRYCFGIAFHKGLRNGELIAVAREHEAEVQREAGELVEENWETISRLAHALERYGTLVNDDVTSLVAAAI